MIFAIILFAIMYTLLIIFADYRPWIALATAGIFMVFGILPLSEVLTSVNWNVIMMLCGTMVIVELFIQSHMPSKMAEILLCYVPNVQWAVVGLSLFAGLISAFVDNVATVLMVAPIGLAVSKKLKVNPVPVIIAIAVSSNLQGAATLVGDTTSILLGGYANMSFNEFFWFLGRPSIALPTEIGALLTIPVLLWLFRKDQQKIQGKVETVVKDYVPSCLMLGVIACLIIASQFEHKPELTNGYICMGLALVGLIWQIAKYHDGQRFKSVIQAIDYKTLLLLVGLFMVIEGITQAGVIDAIAKLFVTFGGQSPLLMYVLIVIVSVVISAFVDNIPYVATMLPVVQGIAIGMGIEPYVFYFGLLIGATLGGNLTPVGASANITGIGILQKAGYKVSSKDFMQIGIPFTLVAVIAGALANWLIWA